MDRRTGLGQLQSVNVAITGWGSISPLGSQKQEIWNNYKNDKHCFKKASYPFGDEWVAKLSEEDQELLRQISNEKLKYKQLDPSVWLALAASRAAINDARWSDSSSIGINIGSSRGATTAFEKYHSQFLESGKLSVDLLSSPTTTLGNIASWVATDLGSSGPAISHSITCSTALHALINAVVWISSGFAGRFLAGGAEAPLSPFTLAQMKALKVYSNLDDEYPCRSMEANKKKNSMILGEGAACFCLQKESESAHFYITGMGYGTEVISHGASLSDEGHCIQKAMTMALTGHSRESVDAIVLHCPGTIKGDISELYAIERVFGDYVPLLTSNKWKMGHTFGASGALSLEMALLMLQHNEFIRPPYLPPVVQRKPLQKILVNALGFGGNAASVIVEKATR